ncbi:adenylate/guanylate cyclase domain-containing protein [Bradyrhizobium diazoefficiens]|uniref:adenylate/guanylate cyclase domain-containing protein n=1 Tax=Bradyrhizobium tunisiense TaxID=3278709 RepID=UPI001BA92DF9|nr:adenylate/guanylate cyclase domain-containing protein [Bradyrhizobium diazoefficiens]MBR0814265.1 adenylate/guanylate cyclase domain-containing protein [Bradyrhizobium diazoefficiens]
MTAANQIGIASVVNAWEPACMSSERDTVRVEHAAVLFADIIGSTCMSEEWSPAETINFLRSYQQRMAMRVIQHQGRVIQYQGDAIVATFGDAHDARCAAGRALSCAFGMLHTIAAWSAERSARGELPLSIGIGVHFGSVGMGQIGVEQHLEQAIAGDTVNVARKLEALTRKLGAFIVVSDELLGAIRRQAHLGSGVEKLKPNGLCRIAGRASPISTWLLPRDSLTA